MSRPAPRRRLGAAWPFVAGLSLSLVLAAALTPAAATAQRGPQNLQVLPEDISREDLTGIMRGFTFALGVRCSTCHVGEEGEPLSTYDFASDDKPMKLKARAMLRMARAINNDHLAELPDRREPNVRVTCVTCHRGVSRPQPIEDVVRQTLEGEGLDAALLKYRELRDRYYGGFAYDFTDGPLVRLARTLGDDAQAVVGILETNLDFNPESAPTLFSLAQHFDEAGDTDQAVTYYRRGLEIAPGNRRAQDRLKELTGGA